MAAHHQRTSGVGNPRRQSGLTRSSSCVARAPVARAPVARARRLGGVTTRLRLAAKKGTVVCRLSSESTGGANPTGTGVSVSVEGPIGGIVCDEFECTCGPDVERTIRQVMRDTADVQETQRSLAPYAENVLYSDGVVSFKGRTNYRKLGPFFTSAESSRGTVDLSRQPASTSNTQAAQLLSVKSVDMGEKVTVVSRVTAETPAGELVVQVTDRYTMNLISGKVVEHEASYEAQGNPAAGAVLLSRRAATALKFGAQKASDVIDSIDEATQSGEDANNYYPDPNNPNKFFQQEDSTFSDGVQIALILSVLYTFVKALIYVNENVKM